MMRASRMGLKLKPGQPWDSCMSVGWVFHLIPMKRFTGMKRPQPTARLLPARRITPRICYRIDRTIPSMGIDAQFMLGRMSETGTRRCPWTPNRHCSGRRCRGARRRCFRHQIAVMLGIHGVPRGLCLSLHGSFGDDPFFGEGV